MMVAGIVTSCSSTKHVSSASSDTKKLQQKYASILGIPSSEISNVKLYSFIDDWMNAPYKYGGKSKTGVDCSGFAEILLQDVYGRTVCCSSAEIFSECKSIPVKNLNEGDLVFFKINSSSVSHMGIYLANHKFVHATTQAGVTISDLNDAYYQKYFYKAGRP